ncbi:hypothetical protein [Roseburia inulinivorans]|uniref:Uncharacterized protein n=1 Tax=Roseburia inulinivorans TaxID=360807 RepID=A0A3R6DSE2_9FIRM|nr:hypothetical protein [Roseburia inulinivorans]MBD9194429.1 hypothetical protein [Roseburia inulinivorans]RHA90054.1 hypothetical protein DW914_06030 [Roseburia inulinivorans]
MDQDTALMVLCKVLEKASESSALSRIELTRQKVGEFINGDRNKFVQLEAEVKDVPSYIVYNNYIFSLLGFAVAALAFVESVFPADNMKAAVMLIVLAIELLIGWYMLTKEKLINKWKKYILAVIDEFK